MHLFDTDFLALYPNQSQFALIVILWPHAPEAFP